jgi:hypothetical protein
MTLYRSAAYSESNSFFANVSAVIPYFVICYKSESNFGHKSSRINTRIAYSGALKITVHPSYIPNGLITYIIIYIYLRSTLTVASSSYSSSLPSTLIVII